MNNLAPYGNFNFRVEIGNLGIVSCLRVRNLALGITPVDSRVGDSKVTGDISVPGRVFFENFFLDKTITKGDKVFSDWLDSSRGTDSGTESTNISISLLNNRAEAVFSWRISNAIPVRLSWSNLDAQGNEVLIETLEVRCEGISVESI